MCHFLRARFQINIPFYACTKSSWMIRIMGQSQMNDEMRKVESSTETEIDNSSCSQDPNRNMHQMYLNNNNND